jgi:hypothetical protein
MTAGSEQTKRDVQGSDLVDRIAGAGLVAFGVVHLLIGWLAVQLALGDPEGGASSTGAVKELAQQPFGQVLVWLVAVGMVLLVLWRLIEAFLGYRDEDGAEQLGHRALSGGKAVVYGAIAVTAIDVATGSTSQGGGSGGGGGGGGGSTSPDSISATLMSQPGGQLLVGAVGVGIVAVGVALLVMAWKESYLDGVDAAAQHGRTGTAFRVVARVGHVAKGLALGVVGGLFLYAAATHEAKESGGLDQALRTVREQSFGPVLLAAIGLGFAAYGVFCFVRARHLDR